MCKQILSTALLVLLCTGAAWGQTARDHYRRGEEYFRQRNYDRAIEEYNEALRLDSGYAVVYFSRALAYTYKGDSDQVIADCSTALKLDPNSVNAATIYSLRASTYDRQGEYDNAIADFTEIVGSNPMILPPIPVGVLHIRVRVNTIMRLRIIQR